jgi:hypothetical protein
MWPKKSNLLPYFSLAAIYTPILAFHEHYNSLLNITKCPTHKLPIRAISHGLQSDLHPLGVRIADMKVTLTANALIIIKINRSLQSVA